MNKPIILSFLKLTHYPFPFPTQVDHGKVLT